MFDQFEESAFRRISRHDNGTRFASLLNHRRSVQRQFTLLHAGAVALQAFCLQQRLNVRLK